jgi:hypothetical protein
VRYCLKGSFGPSKKDFSSARTAAVVSQNLTKNTSDIINEYFKSNTNENNKRKIIEVSLNSIAKTFQISEEMVVWLRCPLELGTRRKRERKTEWKDRWAVIQKEAYAIFFACTYL